MTTAYDPRAIGPLEFAHLGAENTVYIRAHRDAGGIQHFVLHAVDGTQIVSHASYEEALATAQLNDLVTETLH